MSLPQQLSIWWLRRRLRLVLLLIGQQRGWLYQRRRQWQVRQQCKAALVASRFVRLVYLSHEATAASVCAEYEDVKTGEKRQVRASYLVACDGANSLVRQQLGIGFNGVGHHNYTTNVLFKSEDLFAYHDKRPGYRWLFIGPEGVYGTMSAINGRNEWRAQLFNDEKRAMTPDEIRARLERMIGRPFEYELVSVLNWARRELVADSFRKGRVFLAGDACHATSPTGGFGMNTGIKDAVDLAWKLDAELRGWAGPGLLDSYDLERRPSATRAVREASGNWRRMMSVGSHPKLLEPTYEGALLRYDVGRRFSATMLREWYKLGIDLGYVYHDSPICLGDEAIDHASVAIHSTELPADAVPKGFTVDGAPLNAANLREWQRLMVHMAEGSPVKVEWTELSPAEVMVYRQTSAPGARAPHVWLQDGRSTLDWYGRRFVLLKLGDSAPFTLEFEVWARTRGLPLEVVECKDAEVVARYARRLVLVRPDGHVAWRGDRWPACGTAALVDRVRGA